MSFSKRFNKLLTTASLEDLGPVEDDRLSEGQLKDIEERKELEDVASEQQEALDALSKEMATRDDGDGEIGDIREALQDVRETQSEINGIRKQLEVANNNAVVAEDQKLDNDGDDSVPEAEDLEATDDDTLEGDDGDVEGDDAEAAVDDAAVEEATEEAEAAEDDDEDEDEDEESAAVESIRLQINNIYDRLGVSTGIESYGADYPKDLARSQLLGVVASIESHLGEVRPSLEWFNINALQTTIVSIFSVAKALEMNKKLIDMAIRKHGDDAQYLPVSLPEWALELITVDNRPSHDFKSDVITFAKHVRYLIDNVVLRRAERISQIASMFDSWRSLSDADVQKIIGTTNEFLSVKSFKDIMSKGNSNQDVYRVINSGTFKPMIDVSSGYITVEHARDRNPDWFKRDGLKGVYLTSVPQDDLAGLYTLVLPAKDVSEIFGVLLGLLDDIKRFSGTMEKSHKGIKAIAGLTKSISALRPELSVPLQQLEAVALGLYTSTDALSTALKQVMFRFTSLSSYIKYT